MQHVRVVQPVQIVADWQLASQCFRPARASFHLRWELVTSPLPVGSTAMPGLPLSAIHINEATTQHGRNGVPDSGRFRFAG